jgi:hypothetical protein
MISQSLHASRKHRGPQKRHARTVRQRLQHRLMRRDVGGQPSLHAIIERPDHSSLTRSAAPRNRNHTE